MSADNTQDVLEFVNNIRSLYELEPLERLRSGKRSAVDCPITLSVQYGADFHYVTTSRNVVKIWVVDDDGHDKHYCPDEVSSWIRGFDSGAYPEYDMYA